MTEKDQTSKRRNDGKAWTRRKERGERIGSRASERARLGGRTSVRIDRQNARWCGQKFRVTSKRRGYEHLLAEINKRRSGPPCRRDLLEAHATWRRYLLPSDGSLPQNTPPGLTLLNRRTWFLRLYIVYQIRKNRRKKESSNLLLRPDTDPVHDDGDDEKDDELRLVASSAFLPPAPLV